MGQQNMSYETILNQKIQNIQPSGIRKFFDILAEMDDAISLGIGEPDFITPNHIRRAGIHALESGHTKYTANAGMLELRQEITNYLDRRFAIHYDYKSEVLVTVGGSEAIDLALRVLVEPEDEVIVPTPSFVCYGPLAEIAGGKAVYVETKEENEFRLTAEELKAAITPKTKALVLAFPSNPTGGIMCQADLEAIAQVLEGTDIMVITDEIYAELTYGQKHVSIVNLPNMWQRTIYVGGFSKSYAMTGWRMGYVCGPQEIISALTKLHQFGIMSAPTISQHAAIEAMRNGDDDIAQMRDSYDDRRKFLLEGVRRIGLPCFEPRGAFYMFPDIRPSGLSSEEFSERLLLEEKVAVIPGTAFGAGGEGFVRICYAASKENLAESLVRMERFLNRLKK